VGKAGGAEFKPASSSGDEDGATSTFGGGSLAGPGTERNGAFAVGTELDRSAADPDRCVPPVAGSISAAFCSTPFVLVLDRSDGRPATPASGFRGATREAGGAAVVSGEFTDRAVELAAVSMGSRQVHHTTMEISSRAVTTTIGNQKLRRGEYSSENLPT
jgi:hypothetical protein